MKTYKQYLRDEGIKKGQDTNKTKGIYNAIAKRRAKNKTGYKSRRANHLRGC